MNYTKFESASEYESSPEREPSPGRETAKYVGVFCLELSALLIVLALSGSTHHPVAISAVAIVVGVGGAVLIWWGSRRGR